MLIIWLPSLSSFSNQMLSHCCQVPEAFPDTFVQNGFLDEKFLLQVYVAHHYETFGRTVQFPFCILGQSSNFKAEF